MAWEIRRDKVALLTAGITPAGTDLTFTSGAGFANLFGQGAPGGDRVYKVSEHLGHLPSTMLDYYDSGPAQGYFNFPIAGLYEAWGFAQFASVAGGGSYIIRWTDAAGASISGDRYCELAGMDLASMRAEIPLEPFVISQAQAGVLQAMPKLSNYCGSTLTMLDLRVFLKFVGPVV